MTTELTVQPLNVAAVQFNKDEVAAAVATIAERYAGVVVTDKAAAKKDRAELNKMLKQLDDARKAVKRQYEAPLKAFEADIKDVAEPLKAAVDAIDTQIKAIEEQERADRMAALEAVYASLSAVTPLSRVFDDRWVNTSTSAKKAALELTEAVKRADADVEAIVAQHSPHQAAMLDMYFNGAELADVLAYAQRLDAQTFSIGTADPKTPEEIVTELAAENPLNEYHVTEMGIEVTAKTETHRIILTCSDRQFNALLDVLDNLGCFYVVE